MSTQKDYRGTVGTGSESSSANAQATAQRVARDPLANIKRLEENRPGFNWRATPRAKESDIGST